MPPISEVFHLLEQLLMHLFLNFYRWEKLFAIVMPFYQLWDHSSKNVRFFRFVTTSTVLFQNLKLFFIEL